MASAAELKAQLTAHKQEEVRLIYAHRIAQASEHLARTDLTDEERSQTEKHLADLEAAGYHLKKE